MSGPVSFIAPTWRARSGREQVMIAGLGLLILGLIGWYGLYAPMTRIADAAQDRRARATAGLAQVDATVRGLPLRSAGQSGDLEDQIVASAAAAQVPLARHRRESGGEVTVWIEGVAAPAFFAWTRRLNDESGVAVTNLTATRTSDGVLQVEAVLSRPGA